MASKKMDLNEKRQNEQNSKATEKKLLKKATPIAKKKATGIGGTQLRKATLNEQRQNAQNSKTTTANLARSSGGSSAKMTSAAKSMIVGGAVSGIGAKAAASAKKKKLY